MISNQDALYTTSAQGAQGNDLFLRETDSALCDSFCERIVKDGLNLAIVGANDVIADHYCGILVKHLRTWPGVSLELHSTNDTEALLDSFNKILGNLSTAEATGGRNALNPLRILIASGADRISPVQGRLLSRLVSSFPGANTQLVLLQTASGGDGPMSIRGNRLLHWIVPMPSADEARKILQSASDNGREPEAATLLNKINPRLLQDAYDVSAAPAAIRIEDTHSERHIPALPDRIADSDTSKSKARSALSPVLIWGFMIIASSLIVTNLFPRHYHAIKSTLLGQQSIQSENSQSQIAQSQRLPTITPDTEAKKQLSDVKPHEQPQTLDTKTTTVGPEVKTNPSTENPVVAQPVSQESAPLPGKAPGNIRVTPEGEAPAQPGNPNVATLAKSPSEKPAVIRNDASQMQPTQERGAPAVLIPRRPQTQSLADEATSLAIRKIRATPNQQIYVQHVALAAYSDARDWRIANPALPESLIVATFPRQFGKPKFVVLSGPFKTTKEALEFLRGSGIPSEYWLRSADSIVNTLAPTN